MCRVWSGVVVECTCKNAEKIQALFALQHQALFGLNPAMLCTSVVLTFERFFVAVHCHMIFQNIDPCKAFGALGTWESPLIVIVVVSSICCSSRCYRCILQHHHPLVIQSDKTKLSTTYTANNLSNRLISFPQLHTVWQKYFQIRRRHFKNQNLQLVTV